MKLHIVLYIIIASTTVLEAQWIEQNSGTLENLRDVHFTSEHVGYIVGNNGTILKTRDGGDTWNSVSFETSQNIVSVFPLNEDEVFVGGEKGLVAKTEDGGLTWSVIDLGIKNAILIYFVNDDLGFIGTKDQFYRTIDGGKTWIALQPASIPYFSSYDMQFISDTVGYVAIGCVVKTTDGGQNWFHFVDETHPDYNPANVLTSCEIVNEDVGYFGSRYYQGLYKTVDRGKSLTFQERVITDVDFPSPEVGYTIDSFDQKISKTTDAGKNWEQVYIVPDFSNLYKLYFIDEHKGWVVGSSGRILYTDQGGLTTSIEDHLKEDLKIDVELYPNPTDSRITIDSRLSIQNSIKDIELYNNLGQRVYSKKNINSLSYDLQLPDVPAEFFYIKVFMKNGESVSQKIVIN